MKCVHHSDKALGRLLVSLVSVVFLNAFQCKKKKREMKHLPNAIPCSI